MRRWLALALLLGCGIHQVRIRPPTIRNLEHVTFLPYEGSAVQELFDKDGKLCAKFDGKVRHYFAGWQHDEVGEPMCDHDTFEDGLKPAWLELRWRGQIPQDGAYDLVSGGFSAGAWGRVQARGSYYGDFFAKAWIEVTATSPHCKAEWQEDLAKVSVSGLLLRGQEITGWKELADLDLAGCKAGDPLEVRLRLVGESNRGRVEVDGFGFSVVNEEELGRIWGIRPSSAGAAGGPSRRGGRAPPEPSQPRTPVRR